MKDNGTEKHLRAGRLALSIVAAIVLLAGCQPEPVGEIDVGATDTAADTHDGMPDTGASDAGETAGGDVSDTGSGGPDVECRSDDDCDSKVCEGGYCLKPNCVDRVQNGEESGVDCGGSECEACKIGDSCNADQDCVSVACEEGTCVEATCEDGRKNGSEAAVDCGGAECEGCEPGSRCFDDADCASGVCTQRTCRAATCMDDVQNRDESDVDCGGESCRACVFGENCASASDCKSGVCKGGQCKEATCMDGVQNGAETDVDCGGAKCEACQTGDSCSANSDCTNGVCAGGTCVAGSCTDGVKNGQETAVDCGGPTCEPCGAGKRCNRDKDCKTGACRMGYCQAASCSDGTQNGLETDKDCGGPNCAPCPTGASCMDNADCTTRECSGGACRACTHGNERKVGTCGYKQRGDKVEVCASGSWSISTSCRGVWYADCKEYATANPGRRSGVVTIDPDGPSGSSYGPTRVYCDLSGSGANQGWTLLGDFRSDLELHNFDPTTPQRQSTSGGRNVSQAPEIWKSRVFGHLDFTAFPIQGRALKLECRTSPSASWQSVTTTGLFGDWSDGDKGSYGDPNGWGVLRWKTGRSNHFVCGAQTGKPDQKYGGIGICKGPGSGGDWSNHRVSVSFDAPPAKYGGATSIGCMGQGIDRGKGGKWQVRIWVR